jgi:hypothetical protein
MPWWPTFSAITRSSSGLPQRELLLHNRIPLRQVVGESGRVDVRCDLRQLPFAAHSIDLVVMAHASNSMTTRTRFCTKSSAS